MAFYVGNISDKIDCDTLLSTVKDFEGDKRTFDLNFFNLDDPKFGQIGDLWKRAKYENTSIEWFNYYSGKDFPEDYAIQFGNIFNADPVKVWISRIMPGKCFPRHWDADYEEINYEGKQLVRYQLFLRDYQFGHIFILEDTPIIDQKQGDVWQWRNHLVWHGGANIGFENKYIFNFLGEKR